MRVIFCGDSLFSSRNLAERLDQRLVDLLHSADAVLTNAEFSTPKRTTPPGVWMYLTAVKEETLDEFVDLNIRLISMANNHIADYGPQGVVDTLEAAERRGLIPCGAGYNRKEATKARFLDTKSGRVGVVACCTTFAEKMLASDAGTETAARPGLCPLRSVRKYVLPEKEFNQLKQIDQSLGTQQSMQMVSQVETWTPLDEDHFKFGSAFEGNLMIEKGDYAHVEAVVNQEDEEKIMKSVRDAGFRSDFTVVSIHTHEGKDENWYNPEPPAFVEAFAHHAIDNGADVVIGHGAHFSRGVEIYQGHPIFYNLGSLLMEFEAGESMISPDMYANYYLGPDSRPSDLHRNRAKDSEGKWIGFNAYDRSSNNFAVIVDILDDGKPEYRMLPLDIGMRRENCLKRGLPEIMDPEKVKTYIQDLTFMSQKYGTYFEYDKADGTIRFSSKKNS